ncbi:MAG: hypothetical protein KC964_02040 [Candidatus Omnitrophica bacterium]|nr:hypothetical protein [Candidatus Omnitrophota bacterium]
MSEETKGRDKMTSSASSRKKSIEDNAKDALELFEEESEEDYSEASLTEIDLSEAAQKLIEVEEIDGFFHFPTSDYEAQEQFSRLFGIDHLRYAEATGINPPIWYYYDGRMWSHVQYHIHTKIREYIGAVYSIFAHTTKDDWDALKEKTNKNYVGIVKTYVRKLKREPSRKNSILSLLPEELEYRIEESDFDTQPHLLNVNNGTVDLRKGRLLPHDGKDLLKKYIPIDYDPRSSCPRWRQFILDITGGDEELGRFLQKMAGYTSTGETRERQYYTHIGEKGNNGKSTYLETLADILGDYAFTVDRSLFVDINGRHKSTEYTQARLQGVRFAFSSESERSDILSLSKIKTFAGNDTITARNPYGIPFSIKPNCKLHLATNHIPQADGTDSAIWNRTVLIPYDQEFKGEKEDKHLREKLKSEYAGILGWIVEGARLYYKEGLELPKRLLDFREEERKLSDEILCFIQDECVVGLGNEEPAKAVHEAYKRYVYRNYRNRTPFGQRRFNAEMERRAKSLGDGDEPVFRLEKRSNPNQLFFSGLARLEGISVDPQAKVPDAVLTKAGWLTERRNGNHKKRQAQDEVAA